MMSLQFRLPSGRLRVWSKLSGSHPPDVFLLPDLGTRLPDLAPLTALAASKPRLTANPIKHTTIILLDTIFFHFSGLIRSISETVWERLSTKTCIQRHQTSKLTLTLKRHKVTIFYMYGVVFQHDKLHILKWPPNERCQLKNCQSRGVSLAKS